MGLTESESRIIAGLVHQLRDVHPPQAGSWQRWAPFAFGLIFAIFGAVLTNNLTTAREDQRAANARIDAIERRSTDNAFAVERIDRERAARIAHVDARLDTMEARTAPLDSVLKDIGRLETITASHEARLAQGREERMSDTAKIVDGMSVQKTEIALLRQELQQLRHAIEARGRAPSGRVDREASRPATPRIAAGLANAEP